MPRLEQVVEQGVDCSRFALNLLPLNACFSSISRLWLPPKVLRQSPLGCLVELSPCSLPKLQAVVEHCVNHRQTVELFCYPWMHALTVSLVHGCHL
jgi:hypothetical protein